MTTILMALDILAFGLMIYGIMRVESYKPVKWTTNQHALFGFCIWIVVTVTMFLTTFLALPKRVQFNPEFSGCIVLIDAAITIHLYHWFSRKLKLVVAK